MPMLTWEYYHSFHDVVLKDDFDRFELLAEKEIRNVIGAIRWGELVLNEQLNKEVYYEQLLDCICNVMNYSLTIGSKTGNGIASVSNDGYSESYVIQTQSQSNEELKKNIKAWLSGTGLVRAY